MGGKYGTFSIIVTAFTLYLVELKCLYMYLQYIITHLMYYEISVIPHCSCYKAHTYRVQNGLVIPFMFFCLASLLDRRLNLEKSHHICFVG